MSKHIGIFCAALTLWAFCPAVGLAQSTHFLGSSDAQNVFQYLNNTFPESYMELICPIYEYHRVSYTFDGKADFDKRRAAIDKVSDALDKTRAVHLFKEKLDSAGVLNIKYTLTLTIPSDSSDFLNFEVNNKELFFQYTFRHQIPRRVRRAQEMASASVSQRFDSLLKVYTGRKKVRSADIRYKGDYIQNVFNYSSTDFTDNLTTGRKYFVPSATAQEFNTIRNFFTEMGIAWSGVSCCNYGNQEMYDVTVIRYFDSDGLTKFYGAALRNSTLILIRLQGDKPGHYVMPHNWPEDDPYMRW